MVMENSTPRVRLNVYFNIIYYLIFHIVVYKIISIRLLFYNKKITTKY